MDMNHKNQIYVLQGMIGLAVDWLQQYHLIIKQLHEPEVRIEEWKAIDKMATDWEKPFTKASNDAFEEDLHAILSIVSDTKALAIQQKASPDWKKMLMGVEEYLKRYGGDNWREKFTPVTKGVMTAQGQRWAAKLGMQFNVRRFFAEDWFDTYMLKFAQPINDTTLEGMSALLKQAQAEGWSVGETQKHITQVFQQWMKGKLSKEEFAWFTQRLPPHRTEMIARTETIRASNAGSQQLFTEWGVKKHEWLATKDDRVRDSHAAADGQVVAIDEPFNVGGEELMYPGDPAGNASNTINCRCTVLPVME